MEGKGNYQIQQSSSCALTERDLVSTDDPTDGCQMTGHRRGVPSREPNLTDLPVFYFDRIRVRWLHLHLHLSHEGPVSTPGAKRRTEQSDSERENQRIGEDSSKAGSRGLFPRVAAGPSLSVGLRWPSHACYASLTGAPTSYSCFPECQYLSDKQAWLHNSELERHLLVFSNLWGGIFLVGYSTEKS